MADAAELTLERFYIKDLSFESPRAPAVFVGSWKPRMQLDINTRTNRLDDDRFEVVLTVTLEARNGGQEAQTEPEAPVRGEQRRQRQEKEKEKEKEKEGAAETAYIAEVQQAGIFRIRGLGGDQLKRVLATMCPNALFPYLREALDSIIIKGGFPAVTLAPVNFEALYEQARRRQQDPAAQVQH